MAKNKNVGKPRNYALDSGVYRFGKGTMYHKKAIYKFTKKVNKKAPVAKAPVFVEKKVGGAKNGGTRMVRAKKLANDVPTVDAVPAGTSKNFFANHTRKLRASLAPGVVAIVLAGVHKGKRVVVLSQLATGLVLITGPHKLNGCPLRRVNQRYLVATATKLDVAKVKVPENINDKYFAR
jgi:large subunit ribosomal protein L6e